MAAQKKTNGMDAADSLPESHGSPLGLELLTRAVKELNVSRTNTGIYPPDHPQIARTIDRAYEILKKLNRSWPTLTLGVTKDCLILGGERLDPKSLVFKEFAVALNSRDIVSITLIEGLRKEELLQFHRIINTDPEEIREDGGISEVMRHAGMNHILIQAVDYRYFHLTEEEEITQAASKNGKGGRADIWQAFVRHLISGRLVREGQGVPLESWQNVDPVKLSEFINEYQLDPKAIIGSYEEIIAKQLSRVCDPQTMEKLNALLRNLRPELRRQFLSVTFDQVHDRADALMGGFGDDLVLEMLQQANEAGREISPTLLALVHELSGIKGTTSGLTGTGWAGESPGDIARLSKEQFRKLFDRESYESYVDADYGSTLERLSGSLARDAAGPPASASGSSQPETEGDTAEGDGRTSHIPEFNESLDEGHLAVRTVNILLSLMGQEIEGEDYEVFAQKLVEYAPDLLKAGDFELLLKMLNILHRHVTEKSAPISQMAEKSLQSFTDSYFISKAAQAFRNSRDKKIREASAFLQALGSSCVPGLMDLYALEEFPASNRALINLLTHFREAAVEEAQKRLKDWRVNVVRNLIAFLQNNGNASCIPRIRPLLLHDSQWVRMDALSTLLNFKDGETLDFLRKALQSVVPEESSRAVKLAGLYRVGEMVDDLVRMIKVMVFRRSDYKRNEEVIKALGRIGDPKVLPTLAKLAHKTWALYPSDHMHMKLTLFESLGGYPREHLTALLNLGAQSKDYRIRATCGTIQRGI